MLLDTLNIKNFRQTINYLMRKDFCKIPLNEKLGLLNNNTVRLINAPENYFDLLKISPTSIFLLDDNSNHKADFTHFFGIDNQKFRDHLKKIVQKTKVNGIIWISWPRKKEKQPGYLNEYFVRNAASDIGLTDVKSFLFDQTWNSIMLAHLKYADK